MPIGTVLWFDRDRGYGFIKPAERNSPDVHLCIPAIERAGLDVSTIEHLRISYTLVEYQKRTYAWRLISLGRDDVMPFPKGDRIDTTVRWFDAINRGFGFLESELKFPDLFVSAETVVASPLRRIGAGDRVSCLPVQNRGRWEASQLRSIRD